MQVSQVVQSDMELLDYDTPSTTSTKILNSDILQPATISNQQTTLANEHLSDKIIKTAETIIQNVIHTFNTTLVERYHLYSNDLYKSFGAPKLFNESYSLVKKIYECALRQNIGCVCEIVDGISAANKYKLTFYRERNHMRDGFPYADCCDCCCSLTDCWCFGCCSCGASGCKCCCTIL